MDRDRTRRRSAFWLLRGAGAVVLFGLAACAEQPAPNRYAPPTPLAGTPANAPAPTSQGTKVAVLLPLTGPAGEIGQSLLKATQLSFAEKGAPELLVQDTGGTAEGAVKSAQAAIAGGAGIILGPLTAGETNAVAPLARAAGIPVLAFTSDSTLAQPGVWTLGITPQQQVRRLVLAVQAENKTKLAAIVPENPFGEALAAGMTATATTPPAKIVRVPGTFNGFNDAMKSLSDYASRRGAIEAKQREARASSDADTRKTAAEIGRTPVPPPPMEALLLGITGPLLGQIVPLLSFYDIGPDQVRILGPATWSREAARLPALAGAWYAAPEAEARGGFEKAYTAKFNSPPRDIASLAYDAAGIARAVATGTGFPTPSLTRPEGFAGADGLVALMPDGHVRRGLAIFEIDRSGSHMVQPAPKTLAAPGV